MKALQDVVSTLAEELQVPGVAVGLLYDGQEHHAVHGVTNVEHPLPVDERTLFLCGSTTKTFTATALMRLVEQDRLDLDAPVRSYLPEFRVDDEDAASSVTVTQLLNHTAGWDGDFFKDTGEGDDALERYVAAMAGLRQLTRPGEVVSYNNASFGIAGRVLEKVAEMPYEEAVRTLLLEPLGMSDTVFFSRQMVTRRFASGHQRLQDGSTTVMPFGLPRGGNPEGGLVTTTPDLVKWARFHIEGDASVLSPELTRSMREPTVQAPGWSSGDAVGLSWLMGDVAGHWVVGHGGSMPGQLSLFKTVPEQRFALVVHTNVHPVGAAFNGEVMRWAWANVLDAPIPEPETIPRSAEEVEPFCGRYETIANIVIVARNGDGISLETIDRPEVLEELGLDLEQEPPVPFEFCPGDGDRIICTTPPYRGSKGFFTRDKDGSVVALNAFGRHTVRTE